MDWFRMYGDMPNDPKIGTLNDAEFRTWVELLCAACKASQNGNTGLTKDTINWALRRNVTETFQKLFDINLVCFNEAGEIIISAWEKRQFTSDSSTGRVKKHREKQKNQEVTDIAEDETLQKRSSNGLDTDTDTDKNIKPIAPAKLPPKFSPLDYLLNKGVEKQLALDWLKVRKEKKSASTLTAFEDVANEIRKAGIPWGDAIKLCCVRGWAGFKASWPRDDLPAAVDSRFKGAK